MWRGDLVWVTHVADRPMPFTLGHLVVETDRPVLCCVSIDYLVRPVTVLREVARVLAPGGAVVLTFSNRCCPTKDARGWLATDEDGRVDIVRAYLEQAGFADVTTELRTAPHRGLDPLYAAWARST